MELEDLCFQYMLCRVLPLFRQSENQRDVITDELPELSQALLENLCALAHTPAGDGTTVFSAVRGATIHLVH